jgi:hypothetical protein
LVQFFLFENCFALEMTEQINLGRNLLRIPPRKRDNLLQLFFTIPTAH